MAFLEDMGLGKKNIVKIIIILVAMWMIMDTSIAVYLAGIPRTHKGSIIYVDHRYNKWCDYPWTDVEVLTYSGDSHHIQFWDHVEFELGKTYEIHTVKEAKLYVNAGWATLERIVELNEVSSSDGG